MAVPLKILVVENSEDDVELLVAELRHRGFDPEWKRVASEAEFCAGLNEELEVVFSDFTLPQFSARRAIQVLKERGIEVPLIVVSGAIGENAAVDCIKMGAADCLVKSDLAPWSSCAPGAAGPGEGCSTGRARLEAAVHRALVERRLRREKQQAEAALRAAGAEPTARSEGQNMESIGRMTNAVTHEFNNLIAGIRCQTENVLAYETISPSARADLELVLTATERAAHLTRRLIAFTRQQPMQPAPLSLNALIANLAQTLQRPIGGNLKLRLQLAPNLPPIYGDQGLLEQVLLHLAANAMAAMPHGGELTFSTALFCVDAASVGHPPGGSSVSSPESKVQSPKSDLQNPKAGVESAVPLDFGLGTLDAGRVSWGARAGEFVSLKVSDTGSGIPPELLPRIFEPILKTKEGATSICLGLATVFRIVQQHQGWIEAESRVGRGTTMRLGFPARRDLAAAANLPTCPAGGRPGQSCASDGNETVG